MKHQKKNSIDLLIEKLASEFSKIPNFDLTQTDDSANRLFNFVIGKFSEIQDFKLLYKKYYIPASRKAIIDSKNVIRASLYRKVLKISDDQLRENYYDTIRLGYVGLFHKVDNFIKDLLIESNLLFNEGKTGKDSIEFYYEKNYDFKFNNWYGDLLLHKINWICNCVKHCDGYPKKLPKCELLSHLPEDEKVKIDHEVFFADIDYVIEIYYQLKLSQAFTLSMFKMALDIKDESLMTDEQKLKFIDMENKIRLLMK